MGGPCFAGSTAGLFGLSWPWQTQTCTSPFLFLETTCSQLKVLLIRDINDEDGKTTTQLCADQAAQRRGFVAAL